MKSRIIMISIVALVSCLVTAIFFWRFEYGVNEDIVTYFDVVWWWVVTSATVGYGDIVPATNAGRVVGIFAIITGFFIYTNMVAIIAESVHGLLDRNIKGRVPVRASGHIVICEYTAVADELIQALPDWDEMAGRKAVIVTDLVTHNPYPRLHKFVFGVPINPASLKMAAIANADFVFVFANFRFADPDVKTMHIASRVMALNSKARIYVELVDPESDLVKFAPDRMVVLKSRKLIQSVMKDGRISAASWREMCKKADSRLETED